MRNAHSDLMQYENLLWYAINLSLLARKRNLMPIPNFRNIFARADIRQRTIDVRNGFLHMLDSDSYLACMSKFGDQTLTILEEVESAKKLIKQLDSNSDFNFKFEMEMETISYPMEREVPDFDNLVKSYTFAAHAHMWHCAQQVHAWHWMCQIALCLNNEAVVRLPVPPSDLEVNIGNLYEYNDALGKEISSTTIYYKNKDNHGAKANESIVDYGLQVIFPEICKNVEVIHESLRRK